MKNNSTGGTVERHAVVAHQADNESTYRKGARAGLARSNTEEFRANGKREKKRSEGLKNIMRAFEAPLTERPAKALSRAAWFFGMLIKVAVQSLPLIMKPELPNRYRDGKSCNRYRDNFNFNRYL